MVALCVLLVALINFSSGSNPNGNIFDTLTGNDSGQSPLKNNLATEASKKNNLAIAPLSNVSAPTSTADVSADYADFYSADDYAAMYQPEPTLDNQILFASVAPQTPTAKEKQGSKTYEVKMGDTASTIAAAFGISTSTILSANNLSDTSLLKPGDKLTILPITAASYKIQKGDTLEAIAKKYNVDSQKIIAYNESSADGNLKEGQTLVLPDGYLSPAGTTQSTGVHLAIAGQSSLLRAERLMRLSRSAEAVRPSLPVRLLHLVCRPKTLCPVGRKCHLLALKRPRLRQSRPAERPARERLWFQANPAGDTWLSSNR